MANMALSRVKREFKEVMNSENDDCHIKIELIKDNWYELRGEISGPPDTPYEGGIFQVKITIPESYPFQPPDVRFITKIWHPNVSSVTGAICLDILRDNWAAAMTLRTVLLSIQALMSAAEPDDPQDAVVAQQFKQSNDKYKQTAQHWTNVYAGGPHKHVDFDNMVQKLKDLGVDEDVARGELSKENWNLEKASDSLFN